MEWREMAQEIRVVKMRAEQIESAVELLARAFHDQPYGVFYEPDPARRMRLLREKFSRLVRYCFAYGEPYVAADEPAGVALWMPPHATPMTSEEVREFGLDQLPEIFGEAAFARFRPLRDLISELHERNIKEPHWYLPTLGVEPTRQGSGVASALLRPVLARADSERLPCYLDTAQSRNVPFYRRHGFQILVEGTEPVSGLPYWTFRREPRHFP
ncbi:MAG: GNAT family N-acetyltransferase [Candidatus Binataceae bacterium]